MSLRRRLAGLFVLASVLLVLIAALSVASFVDLLNARSTLVDEVDPASLQADELLLAYVDQETGVRGYVLSRNPAFLQPYESGLVEQHDAAARLRKLLAGRPQLLEKLASAQRQGARWQTEYAQRAIEGVRTGGATTASERALLASKQLFDSVRSRFATLGSALSSARAIAAAQLGNATRLLIWVLVAAAAIALVAGLLAWRALRIWVTTPLLRLGSEAREVATGDLAHPIARLGPPELQRLAGDVEAMRQRIVGELAEVTSARTELAGRNAELARSNLELEQFAYVASHDLQEPLRKVTSFVQLLQQRYGDQLDERADQYMHFAVDGAKRMQALINDLLAFSRVGRTTERFGPVALASCLEAALANLATLVEETGAIVEAEPLPIVQGDAGLLTLLWQNLVGNSLKFHGAEPPVVKIEAGRRDDGWICSVTDNGIGIEPRFSERIFVIFQRLHGRDVFEGTGIGLAMCKKIVEFHGGTIWLDREHSAGARLWFTLPDGESPVNP